jgi:hypothetical protein
MARRAGRVGSLLVDTGWASLPLMSHDEEPRGTPLNLRQGLLVLGLLKSMERRQDPDRPSAVPGGPEVEAVLKRAGQPRRWGCVSLSGEGREPDR